MKSQADADRESATLEILAAIDSANDRAFDRFVELLPAEAGVYARETSQLRKELVEHFQQTLNETDVHRAMAHVEWIRDHAGSVVYRWYVLRRAYERWATRDVRPFAVSVSGGFR